MTALKPMATITENTPMAMAKRVVNHFPTLVTLIVESALCPTPRMRTRKIMSDAAVTQELIAMTRPPRRSKAAESMTLIPHRSVSGPAIKANALPNNVAMTLMLAN